VQEAVEEMEHQAPDWSDPASQDASEQVADDAARQSDAGSGAAAGDADVAGSDWDAAGPPAAPAVGLAGAPAAGPTGAPASGRAGAPAAGPTGAPASGRAGVVVAGQTDAPAAVPATGEPRVDAALKLLERLPGLPVADHAELFEQVHAQLSEVLGELDSGSSGPAGG